MTYVKHAKDYTRHVVQDERSKKADRNDGRFYQAIDFEPRTAWERDNVGKPRWNNVRRNVSGFWWNLRETKKHVNYVANDGRSRNPSEGRFYQALDSEPRTAWERDNAGKPRWNTVRRNVSGFWHNLRKG
jgi:hypothetical protein